MTCKDALLESVRACRSDVMGSATNLHWLQDLPGGDINRAALIGNDRNKWFLKYKQDGPDGMFAAEAQALDEIAQQKCIRVPSPVAFGRDGSTTWLVLEYLQLSADGSAGLLGEHLAALHAVSFEKFGWGRNNFIGTTVQMNFECNHWGRFWRENRLVPQLALAEAAGYSTRLIAKGEQLLDYVDQILSDHKVTASLLHGDLWAGNKAFTPQGQPVIFDPASYYGDRETDIAMSELFGGFGKEFYAAYCANLPLSNGYQLRRDLYNLYHMLNHLNLFGAGYLSRCEDMIDHLLAQIR